MKPIALFLVVLCCIPTFCLVLQQSAVKAQNLGPQVVDSDTVFQAALRPARPRRDYVPDIEKLLGQMTLEEKVGQMTQLEIGMVTSGRDQDIRIDPAKLDKAVVSTGPDQSLMLIA